MGFIVIAVDQSTNPELSIEIFNGRPRYLVKPHGSEEFHIDREAFELVVAMRQNDRLFEIEQLLREQARQ